MHRTLTTAATLALSSLSLATPAMAQESRIALDSVVLPTLPSDPS